MQSRVPAVERTSHRLSLALVWSLFFVLLQSFSIGHAAEYGDSQHFHNGETCLLQAVADRDDEPGLLPQVEAAEPISPFAEPSWRPAKTHLTGFQPTGFHARAPPANR